MPELQIKQANTEKPRIDFDSWSELAQQDPEAFEKRRAEVIEQVIQSIPTHKQHRMRCLQWKIDQIRARAGNPLSACIKLSELMWDSLLGPGGLREVLEGASSSAIQPPPTACVLSFERTPRGGIIRR
jgi:hypothetical protein